MFYYSPLVDTLKKGISYNFTIKCESAKEMFVFDDLYNLFPLTKNNTIFSQQLTFNNTASEVGIGAFLLDSEEIILFYSYKLSDI